MAKPEVSIGHVIAVLGDIKRAAPKTKQQAKQARIAATKRRLETRQQSDDDARRIRDPRYVTSVYRLVVQSLKIPIEDGSSLADTWDLGSVEWIKTDNYPYRHLYEERFSSANLASNPEWISLFQSPTHSATQGDSEAESIRKMEGTHREVLSNKPERSAALRMACLQHFGDMRCQACNMDFVERYQESLDSPPIDVHHRYPLERGVRETDAKRDLIPLCPNCHRMVHCLGEPYIKRPELLRKRCSKPAHWWKTSR
ncbi:MAG: HNH endonuclease [Planctomycetota bacterium]